jgi:DNA-directed RNA polymerase alpha subunit
MTTQAKTVRPPFERQRDETTAFCFYLPGQVVKTKRYDGWYFGIVTEATDIEHDFTQVLVKLDQNVECRTVPGLKQSEIRMATQADINNAPEYVKQFIERDRLNRKDPLIPSNLCTAKTMHALSAMGIKRFSNLQKASNTDLLQLKGVGSKAVDALRHWQAETADLLKAGAELEALANA